MNTTKEEKIKEAVERMNLLNIYPQTIRQFETEGLISESLPPVGACYWIEGEQLKRVKAFEEKTGGIVYHVIRGVYEELGEMECYLYVNDYPDEWPIDREDIKRGQIFAFVNNVNNPDYSEFGYIGVELTPAAGLRRTW